MLPWVTAVALLVVPIMVADFDYRYLIPVIPFACMAAGLGFAPRRAKPDRGPRPVDRDRRVHRPRLGFLVNGAATVPHLVAYRPKSRLPAIDAMNPFLHTVKRKHDSDLQYRRL